MPLSATGRNQIFGDGISHVSRSVLPGTLGIVGATMSGMSEGLTKVALVETLACAGESSRVR